MDVLTAALISSLAAQEPQKPQEPPVDEGRLQFAVSVETVTLDVVVVDKKGRFVPGLVRESFEILEDGIPQNLSFFTAQFTPVTTILLLDSSSSIRESFTAIQTAAYLFAQNLSEGDRARIGLFNSEVRFGAGYTDDISAHLAVLKTMKPEGTTALYDAILAALDELETVEGRKSLVIFTDGDDAGAAKGSKASIAEVIEAARQSEVTIYAVGYMGKKADGTGSVNRPLLTSLAEATGGRPFFPEGDVDAVKKAFAEVQQDLHRHYRMAYVPSTAAGELTGWRNIQVKVKTKPGLFVRTRQGYYTRIPSE